ncbi:MAG: M67 family metallopeptidase [Eubacterium sp.]
MLYMTKDDYEKIVIHCKEGLPNEACGLIGGTKEGEKKHIRKVYFLTNKDESNEHFSMDPKEQFAAVRDMRANGYQLLGNFHSHPKSHSRPSKEDKRLAYDSKVNYLILSLMDLQHPVLNAFVIDEEKNVSKEELIIS